MRHARNMKIISCCCALPDRAIYRRFFGAHTYVDPKESLMNEYGVVLGTGNTALHAIIQAKRVSNCYIQEKKLSVCVCGCSTNLGFSVEKFVLVLVQGTYYVPARTAVQASCGEKHSTEWRLPSWCPQRRSPLVPSRTDTSNSHVI